MPESGCRSRRAANLLSDLLEITVPNLVLRGEGPEKTVLLFTRSLQEIKPTTAETGDGKATTAYSWSGGLIHVTGPAPNQGNPVAVTAPAKRGEMKLTFASHDFKMGDEVLLTVTDTASIPCSPISTGAGARLQRDLEASDPASLPVTAVKANEVTLDRGLRFDVNADWNPTVTRFAPRSRMSGSRKSASSFPRRPTRVTGRKKASIPSSSRGTSHTAGPATSGLERRQRSLRRGMVLLGGRHRPRADRRRGMADGISGHHGITLNGSDGLCTNFVIETRFLPRCHGRQRIGGQRLLAGPGP